MGSIYRFVYKALIGKDEYPEGCGKTAKEAKQKAALLAWRKIEDQLQSHSQVRIYYVIFFHGTHWTKGYVNLLGNYVMAIQIYCKKKTSGLRGCGTLYVYLRFQANQVLLKMNHHLM